MITIRAEMPRRDYADIVDIGSAPSQINIINSAAQRQRPNVTTVCYRPVLSSRSRWISSAVSGSAPGSNDVHPVSR